MPADATALSFGLNLFNNGTLTTDDLSMIQARHRGRRAPLGPPRPPPRRHSTAVAATRPAPASKATTEEAQGRQGHHAQRRARPDAAAQRRQVRAGTPNWASHPAHVVLAPFVVSPELTRG